MAKTTESKVADEFMIQDNKINDLTIEAADWSKNEYARSNERLYKILQGCFDLVKAFKGKEKLQAALMKKLEKNGIKTQANTKLEAIIIKLVFQMDFDRRRASAYAKVLQVAKEEKVESVDLPFWIVDKGGIEEIRRSTKIGEDAKTKKSKEIDIVAFGKVERKRCGDPTLIS